MNKGLFAHIVATMLYALLVLFVLGDYTTSLGDRVFITTILLLINMFVCAASDINEWYDKKI